MPAKTIYSYYKTLYSVLDEFRPRSIFEWGPGTSTQIMALHDCKPLVHSVEHEDFFYDKVAGLQLDGVTFELQREMAAYVSSLKDDSRYDLIFIDGRSRAECLERAASHSNLVMLHDAARADYRDAVDSYKFQVWTDDGNTVCLTNEQGVYEQLMSCLEKMVCAKPEPEFITMLKGAIA